MRNSLYEIGESKHCALTIYYAMKASAWLEQEMTYVVNTNKELAYNDTTLFFLLNGWIFRDEIGWQVGIFNLAFLWVSWSTLESSTVNSLSGRGSHRPPPAGPQLHLIQLRCVQRPTPIAFNRCSFLSYFNETRVAVFPFKTFHLKLLFLLKSGLL